MATVSPKLGTAKGMKIQACMANCKHEGQDKIHGRGKRAMNPGAKGYKCTVCGKIQN